VEERHLTKGYASFWNAGINQYYADNKVMFIRSGCSPKAGVRPYRWLLNEQVLSRPASNSFYLFDPAATRCTQDDLSRFFGLPQQVTNSADRSSCCCMAMTSQRVYGRRAPPETTLYRAARTDRL
jgi:hypothetical protein